MAWSERIRSWARQLKRDGVTLWFAWRHPDTPWAARALSALVVAYALSPIDLIPDFIPVLGYLDDVILLPALIWLALRLIPAAVLDECRARAIEWMAREHRKPRSIWGMVFVLCVWGLACWGLWWLVGHWRS